MNILKLVGAIFCLLLFTFGSSLMMAKGSELKFSSLVSAVSGSGDEGTVTVDIQGVDIQIIVIADTDN